MAALPDIKKMPPIHPHYVTPEQKYKYTPYQRDPKNQVR